MNVWLVVTAGYNLIAVAETVRASLYLLDPALAELRRFAVSGSHDQTSGNIRTTLLCVWNLVQVIDAFSIIQLTTLAIH